MPNFPIVDTHLHIWNLKRLRYAWLDSNALLNRDHLIEEYRRVCGPVQIPRSPFPLRTRAVRNRKASEYRAPAPTAARWQRRALLAVPF